MDNALKIIVCIGRWLITTYSFIKRHDFKKPMNVLGGKN